MPQSYTNAMSDNIVITGAAGPCIGGGEATAVALELI
jgi:hypothetical protein